MENNEITSLLRKEKELKTLLEKYEQNGIRSERERLLYEEAKREYADILRRKNHAY